MPTALVTGAAGFIGSHLVNSLIGRGWDVYGVDDLSTGDLANISNANESDNFEFIEGDITDTELVGDVIPQVDHVFHQAALASVPRSFDSPRSTTQVNCTGTATILQTAIDHDIDSVVIASSAAVYGSGEPLPKREDQAVSPGSPYATSKRYTEQIAQQLVDQADTDITALRYFNVYGPRQDPNGEYAAVVPAFVDRLLADEHPIIYGDGEQSRDFVYVADVVDANVTAATAGRSGVYNVARGSSVTINQLVDTLKSITRTDVDPVYEDPRPGDIRHSSASVSKAADELEFSADTTLEEGLRETVDWFRHS